MRYSKEDIIHNGQVLEDNAGEQNYDWIDVVGIPQRPDDLQSCLFLATHSEGKDGWDEGFDRRPYAKQVALDRDWHILTDDEGLDLQGTNHIRVASLEKAVRNIYKELVERTKPFVIGVTGSVGKTTTVSFLEHLIKSSYSEKEVVRFYSKRLTPLSVMCHYINRVSGVNPVILMEYSAYLKDHVDQLSQLLPPNISFLLNISDTHINPGMFDSREEIFKSKLKIKPEKGEAFINKGVLSHLKVDTPAEWTIFDLEGADHLTTNTNLPPTQRTAELFTVGKIVAEKMGIPEESFLKAFRTFIPQENRIIVCNLNGQKIFFHGETSGGSRLWSWFETVDGSCPHFFVEEVNFADENPEGFKGLLEKVFNYSKTYVLDTPENRQKLPMDANFVNSDKFKALLKKAQGYIVYHKALATRQPDFQASSYLQNKW